MKKPKEYFDLDMNTLRALGGWAAGCAERALPIFEAGNNADLRPRQAIDGIHAFAGGGKRAAKLRLLALDAYRAALETQDPAASAAARAASLAAASAYTHPLADAQQTVHILGAAACAALALEIQQGGDPRVGDGEVRWAIDHVPGEVCALLRNMPARQAGKSRLERLMADLDAGLRNRPWDGPAAASTRPKDERER